MGTEPALRYVTAALKVDYLAPTPLGPELELRGTIKEVKGRKVIVAVSVRANGVETAKGEVVAVRLASPAP
jgi:acyl-CoA thioesterase FadM